MINWLTHPFPPNIQITFSPKTCQLGSWNFERKFTSPHLSSVICHMSCDNYHMSCVMCHMSHVICQVSHVTCQVSHVFFLVFNLFLGKSGESCWCRVCHQWGLPCLVFSEIASLESTNMEVSFWMLIILEGQEFSCKTI